MSNHASGNKSAVPSGLSGILETALYVDDLESAERFYGGILGFEKIFAVPDRQLVFRCQESVLLLFNPQHTERERVIINGGAIPLHGARGPGHTAFRVPKSELSTWRKHLCDCAVAIESEVSWPNGAHSIYFRDPAGNSVELATPDMWTNLMLEASKAGEGARAS